VRCLVAVKCLRCDQALETGVPALLAYKAYPNLPDVPVSAIVCLSCAAPELSRAVAGAFTGAVSGNVPQAPPDAQQKYAAQLGTGLIGTRRMTEQEAVDFYAHQERAAQQRAATHGGTLATFMVYSVIWATVFAALLAGYLAARWAAGEVF
jgi:hypothetical protein